MTPMHTTTEPLVARIQLRLARSRFFTLSLLLHTAAVIILGGIVLVQQKAAVEDMASGPAYELQSLLPPEKPEISERSPQPEESRPESKPADVQQPRFEVVALQTSRPSTHVMPSVRVNLQQTAVTATLASLPTAPSGNAGQWCMRFTPDKVKGWGPGTPGPRPTNETEQAVARALAWLRKTQNPDGSWAERNRGAMTGLALLCFLGHGEYGQTPEFGLTVNRGIEWMLQNGTANGSRLSMTRDDWGSGNAGVYEHGIAAYALGEYYTMTTIAGKPDERVVELFRAAIAHIVEGQGPDGGWMYHFDKTQSDTSVSGWQVQALKAAHLSGLKIPDVEKALDRAMINFQRVQTDKGGYGYRKAENRWSLTGVGILSELFWHGTRDAQCRKGVEFILAGLDEFPVRYQHEKADLYAWYYHTQAMLMFGNSSWRKWEGLFSREVVKSQSSDGSWPVMANPAHGNLQKESSTTGATYRTALCVLMLESYYRYLPANRE